MNAFSKWCGCLLLCAVTAFGADDPFDRVDQALTWSTNAGSIRGRVSGIIDAEEYVLPRPAPGVIDSSGDTLFNPRLSLFLDTQWGSHTYGFAQARVDRGFDPSSDPLRARLDEYAVRWTPSDAARFNVQVGKFATVVGNWTPRHDSWSDGFVTAPLPYENLTGLWDNEPPHSAAQLLVWSHIRPGLGAAIVDAEKYLRIPIIWGPSYATGLAVAGAADRFRYALEVKNASLSSRPDAWSPRESGWGYPTVSGRVRYLPNEAWEFGSSASVGTFLRPAADPLLPLGVGREQYRQLVLGSDLSYAWHHVQVWAEVYACRFQVPLIGNADTLAYYVEGRYKLTPQLFAAVRWNQQLYGTVNDRGADVRWGNNTWRVDLAPTYRFTPHVQLKIQYSLQRGNQDTDHLTQMVAVQGTLRF